jgi:NAD(P)-dependent dehydrogenase (short-subunit alcohol dehydrogenase family)
MATLFAAETPLGRIGEPLDIARAVRFLAGPEGAWITGETISADGGLQQGKAPDLGEVI